MNQLLLHTCMKKNLRTLMRKLFFKKINTLFSFILIKQLFQKNLYIKLIYNYS